MGIANGAVKAPCPLKTAHEVVAVLIDAKVVETAVDLDATAPADSKTGMAQKEAALAQNSSHQGGENHCPLPLLKKQTIGEAICVHHHRHYLRPKNEALVLVSGVDSLVSALVQGEAAGLGVVVLAEIGWHVVGLVSILPLALNRGVQNLALLIWRRNGRWGANSSPLYKLRLNVLALMVHSPKGLAMVESWRASLEREREPLMVRTLVIGEACLESLFPDLLRPQDLHEDRRRGRPVSVTGQCMESHTDMFSDPRPEWTAYSTEAGSTPTRWRRFQHSY
jgi:hypothetical protein